MPVELTSIEQLDTDSVVARLQRLAAVMEDAGTGLEVQRGAFHDLVLRPQAVLSQAFSDATDVLIRSTNPVLAMQDSGAIDSGLLNAAAASMGVVRLDGLSAAGKVTIVVSEDRTIIVPSGSRFVTSAGLVFTATQAFAARTTGSTVESLTDRLLQKRPDGRYEFSVDVVSDTEGLAGNVAQDTVFNPEGITIPNFVQAYAKIAFKGGTNRETDQELLGRLLQDIPASSLSTRASVAPVVRSIPVLRDLLSISTIGYGDRELIRGSNPISRVGKADVYIRTSLLPEMREVTLKAYVINVADGITATWQVVMGREVSPGFYRVASVTAVETGEVYENFSVNRAFDPSPIYGELIPELSSVSDATFSRFSTAIIQFKTLADNLVVGDEQEVSIRVLLMPYISEVQAKLSSRAYRFIGGDTLVRAAIPTFVTVGVQVVVRPGEALPDVNPIRDAVANVFNLAGFPSKIYANRISTVVNNLLPAKAEVGLVELITETILPDGTINRRRSTEDAQIPVNESLGVSGRTGVFICDPSNVVLTAYTETLPQVI